MTSGPVRVRVRVRCFRSVEQTTTCEQSPLITMPVGGSLIADAPPTSPNWYYLPRGQNVAAGPSIWRRRMLTVRPSSAREVSFFVKWTLVPSLMRLSNMFMK